MVPCFRYLAILLMPTATFADNLGTKPFITLFESRYREAHSLQVTFLERYSENGRVIRTEAGTAYFGRPGKMRWEYESPEKNLFLVDGKVAWFYVPADHTVMQVPAKESGDWRTPFALLAGRIKVSHLCSRVEIATTERPQTPENALLYCAVRGQSPGTTQEPESNASGVKSHDAVFFEISRETGQLDRILLRQSGGVELEFRFANWQFDPPLPESLFHFAPPIGVAVVKGELPQETSVMK
jgi:outer membrane lipoprotein carrier protein